MQNRKMSLVESVTNTALGFVVAMLTWRFVICPLFGITHSVRDNVAITAIFTVISVARGYLVRRFFDTQFHYVISPKVPSRLDEKFLELRVEDHKRGYRHVIFDGDDAIYMSLNYHSTMEGTEDEAVRYFCKSWAISKHEKESK